MSRPELIFVAGCNAAGKSTFIRTRMDELSDFEILMADVYKGRTKSLAQKAIADGKSVLIETVFNDESFKDLVDQANNAKFRTSLVALILDSPAESEARVAFRSVQQNGITISGSNVKLNFNESFKNIAWYFFYFDRSDFVYTGDNGVNQLIMTFQKSELLYYNSNNLEYPQKFAAFGFGKGRLTKEAYEVINANEDFERIGAGERHGSKFEL
jgi:predicted ABC-type ATPase